MAGRLTRLLRPRSIAFLGGVWARNAVEQCLKMGFDGEIWPVHPRETEIHGQRVYRDLADLPAPPDAAFVAVNRDLSVGVVQALSAMGAGGAVCFASGFRETDDGDTAGAEREAKLVAAAGQMPILGPNCYGLINYLDGALLWPDQHGGTRVERGVAILTQSSNMLINLTMARRGLPLGYCITAGNQTQIGLAGLAAGVIEDPRVTAIGLHVEGVTDVRAWEALAARARALKKPIVALALGQSQQARTAALTHTASLAGSDAAARAFLRRLGIPRVATLPEFLETLKLLHVHGPLAGRRVLSLSCSGGEAVLMADTAARQRIILPPLAPDHRRAIEATTRPNVTVANPFDYHTYDWHDEAALTRTFEACLAGPFDLSVIVMDYPHGERCSDESWEPATRAIEAVAGTGAPLALAASVPETLTEARAERMMAHGIAPMAGLDETLAAARAAAEIGEAWGGAMADPLTLPDRAGPTQTRVLDEAAAKAALAAHGLAVPAHRRAADSATIAAKASDLMGPLALKGLGIAHKTEQGAVRLNLASAAEIEAAARAMPAPAGYLLEEMVTGGIAELILGALRDPPYGFSLTIGTGGIFTELLQDRATLLIPSPAEAVRDAILSLRGAALLNGYRGRPAADIDTIVDAAMALQAYAIANAPRLVEVEINPLIVTPTRAVAADALIRLEDTP